MLWVLIHVALTWIATPLGPAPVVVCVYSSPEIEYTLAKYQPPWMPCAEYRNV
jgi:hypothetical protein